MEEYIEYFTRMEKELIDKPLSEMAWSDISWWVYHAIETDKYFTKNELAHMFPILLGYLREKGELE